MRTRAAVTLQAKDTFYLLLNASIPPGGTYVSNWASGVSVISVTAVPRIPTGPALVSQSRYVREGQHVIPPLESCLGCGMDVPVTQAI